MDCNQNGRADGEDISSGGSQDCNQNLVPDECDVAAVNLDWPVAATVNLGADNRVSALRAADMNGDGRPDVCIASQLPGKMAVRLNLGGGSLGPPRSYETQGPELGRMTVADLNGDGDRDIAVIVGGGSLLLLANNGAGNIDWAGINSLGGLLGAPEAADLDADGDADILVPNTGFDERFHTLFLLRNPGSGEFEFGSWEDLPVGLRPYSVAAADLDGDGDLDLATSNLGSNDVSVLKNDGQGSFPDRMDYPAVQLPTGMAAADFDRDGDADLVVASNSGRAAVLPNTGRGEFPQAIPFVGPGTAEVWARDLDADLYPDLLMAGLVLLNNRDHSFTAYRSLPVGLVAVEDLDADFDMDIAGFTTVAVPGGNEGRLHVMLSARVAYSEDCNSNNVPDECETDCNGNGRPDGCDMAHGSSSDCNANGIPDDCDFTSTIRFAVQSPLAFGTEPEAVEIADLDGDLDLDLAVTAFTPADVRVRLNRGNGVFANSTNYPTGSGATALTAHDLDADGDLDLAVANQFANSISVLPNRGDGTFAQAVSIGAGGQPLSIEAGDLDGDGAPDLLVANFEEATISLFENLGGSSFRFRADLTVGANPSCVVPADMDRDGDLEVLATRWGGDALSVSRQAGDWSFESWQELPVGSRPNTVAVADLDLDSDLDAVVANSGFEAGPGSVSILAGSGDGILIRQPDIHPGVESSSAQAVDLNGDAAPELVVTNFRTATVSVHRNYLGSFEVGRDSTVRPDPLNAAAGDLDGDGGLDLVVTHFSGQAVTILRSAAIPSVDPDCDRNSVPDSCDIAAGTSQDLNANGVPDPCDPDCNANDSPDFLDIANGTSVDCDANAVPDECDPDCNQNGRADACDVTGGTSADANNDGIPDECQGGLQLPSDANQDGKRDLSDAIWLLGHLFLGTAPILPCEGGSSGAPGPGDLALIDANGDRRIDLSDVIRVLGFLFGGSPPPVLGIECIRIPGCPNACRTE